MHHPTLTQFPCVSTYIHTLGPAIRAFDVCYVSCLDMHACVTELGKCSAAQLLQSECLSLLTTTTAVHPGGFKQVNSCHQCWQRNQQICVWHLLVFTVDNRMIRSQKSKAASQGNLLFPRHLLSHNLPFIMCGGTQSACACIFLGDLVLGLSRKTCHTQSGQCATTAATGTVIKQARGLGGLLVCHKPGVQPLRALSCVSQVPPINLCKIPLAQKNICMAPVYSRLRTTPLTQQMAKSPGLLQHKSSRRFRSQGTGVPLRRGPTITMDKPLRCPRTTAHFRWDA